MNGNLLARIAKLAALFCFLLPWVTVSCSGNEIASATGVQLMTGDVQPNPALADMARASGDETQSNADPNAFVIAAFAAIALGLLVSAFLRGRAAAGALLASSLLAMGLSYYSIQTVRDTMTDRASRAQDAANDFARAVAGAVRVEEQEGLWATLFALALASVFALIGLTASGSAPNNRNQE